MSNIGELNSITEHWRALNLFTNRRKLIRLFVNRLNENQPKNKILFFYGDGGNGKSLLLKYLEKNFLKRFTSDAWEQLKIIEDNNAFVQRARDADENFIVIPSAGLNFGIATGGNDQPKQAFFGLLALRRELARYKVKFPLFDFACVWYLHKTEGISQEKLKNLFPAEELSLVTGIVDAVIGGVPFGSLGKATFDVFFKRYKTDFTIYLQRRGLDEARIDQIERMNPNSELIEHLPEFFAEDLNAFMASPGAPERLFLFFDTHEAFYGADRARKSDKEYFQLDQWLRVLLCELEVSSGIIRVVAGREHPCRQENNKSWAKARPCKIEEQEIDAHFIGHLTPADADESLQKAEIHDTALRQSLVRYAEVETDEIHPFYLGLCADIVLAAKRQGKTLTAADFAKQPQIEDQERELIDRFLSYVDADTKDAVIALATCRAFNKNIFVEMGKSLNYHSTNAAFDILKTFSFVWRVERRGEGWYRIHDLLRILFVDYEQEKVRAAHEFLEEYHRRQSNDFSPVEAIYHANQLDWERGETEWYDMLEKKIWAAQNEICRSLIELRGELIVKTDYQLGRVSQIEGDFYFFQSLYKDAEREYQESLTAFNRALQNSLGNASIYVDKGHTLQRIGFLQDSLSQENLALENFHSALKEYDRALEIEKNNALALRRKAHALQDIARHWNVREDTETNRIYQQSFELYEQSLRLEPNSVGGNHNFGMLLSYLGDFQARLEQSDEAFFSYQKAIESYEKAIELKPDSLWMQVNKIRVLNRIGVLHKEKADYEQARDIYQQTVREFDAILQIAPDDSFALKSKSNALFGLGLLLHFNLKQYQEAEETYQKMVEVCDAVLRSSPSNLVVIKNKSRALDCLGDLQIILERRDAAYKSFQSAIDTIKIVLQIAPEDVEALEYIGLGLSCQADLRFFWQEYTESIKLYQQAAEWYDKALNINPKLESTAKDRDYALAKLDEIQMLIQEENRIP